MFLDHDDAFLEKKDSPKILPYDTWNEVHIVYQNEQKPQGLKKPNVFLKTLTIQEEITRISYEDPDEDLEDLLEKVGYTYIYHLGRFLEPEDHDTIQSVRSAVRSRDISWSSVVFVYRTMNGSHRIQSSATITADDLDGLPEREALECLQWWSHRPSFIETLGDLQEFLGSKNS